MATKVGFQLESSLASKHMTDAEYIKGGYLTVATISERDALPIYTASTDGIIVNGSLCYVQADDKFYIYDGSAWKEEEFTGGTVKSITAGNGLTGGTITESGTIAVDTDVIASKTFVDSTYVAKEEGKGLSTNDYTTAEKNKLSGIAEGAEVNVQSDWASTDTASDAYILNKPSIPTKTSDLTNDGEDGSNKFITLNDVPQELFYCTYNTTTYTEITQALTDNKLPVCLYDNYMYIYCSNVDGYLFNAQRKNNIYTLKIDNTSTWSGPVLTQTQSTSDKTQTITEESTTTQYPSAKAVYDVVEDVREVAEGKKQTYVCSDSTNPIFNSQDNTVTATSSLIDINSNIIALSTLNVGDTVYVSEFDVPDRWVSAKQGDVISSDYQEIEYIESTGTQYIDTGLKNAKFVHDIAFTSSERSLMGYSAASPTYWGSANASKYELAGHYIALSTSERRTITYEAFSVTNGTKLTIDDQTVAQSGFTATTNYYLLRINGASYYAKAKLYSCQAYDANDVMLLNLKPCYRKADHEVGMYDTISGTFYANAGTGSFGEGEEVGLSVTFSKLETAKVPITSISKNGTTITPVSGNVDISVPVEDVQLDNTSIIENNIVKLVSTGVNKKGIAALTNNGGLEEDSSLPGYISLTDVSESAIQAKGAKGTDNYGAITTANLDIAVREGLGNTSLTWTDEYKASARTTIGAETNSNKVNVLDDTVTNVQYPGAKIVYDTIEDVREIAEGKKSTYVVSYAGNPAFNSQNNTIEVEDFTDTSAITRDYNDVQIGDTVYVSESDVPDRWVSAFVDRTARVPSEYQEVEYIQSAGSAYIDTGYVFNDDTVIDFDITTVGASGYANFFFGARDTNAANYSGLTVEGGSDQTNIRMGSKTIVSIAQRLNNNHITGHIESGNTSIKYDDILVTSATTYGVAFNAPSARIFCITNGSSGSGKLASFKISENGTVIHNYVPCYLRSTAQAGVYDTVAEEFIVSATTTAFTAGPAVSSDEKNIIFSKLETVKVPITEISRNDISLTPVSGKVNIEVPENTSDLTNDSGFIDKNVNDLTYYTKTTDLPKELYWCTYGTTSFTDIKSAIETNHQLPIIYKSQDLYVCQATGANYARFCTYNTVRQFTIMCSYNTETGVTTWSGPTTTVMESTSNKVTSISSSSTDTQYPSAKCVYTNLEDIREVAEGKKQTYVVSSVTNPIFNTQNNSISTSSFTDINNNTITVNDVKIGDTVYISENGVPDRWVSNFSSLPTGYQKCEYITWADGISYTNSTVTLGKPADFDKIELTYSGTNTGLSNVWLGGKMETGVIYYEGSDTAWKSISLNNLSVSPLLTAAEYNDGTTRTLTFNYTSTISSGSIAIGGYQVADYSKAKKIYGIKCYKNNTLIKNFVPAYCTDNNIIGLYEIVNASFYPNEGDTAFVKGADVLDKINMTLSKLETAKVPITSISKNGTIIEPVNSNVDITIPTKVSDIENDSGFVDKDVTDLTNYTKTADLPKELWWATYGSTTWQEITDAISAGKYPMVNVSGLWGVYYRDDSTGNHLFGLAGYTQNDETTIAQTRYMCRKTDSVWSTATGTVQGKAGLVTTITASSDDKHYPSAKAAYTAIEEVREIAEGKKSTYVVSSVTNPTFASSDTTISVIEFTTTSGTIVSATALKVGDTVYVIESDMSDRWVSRIYTNEGETYAELSKLETIKVPVTDVKVNGTTVVTNTIAEITMPTFATDDDYEDYMEV